jgi:hypothetical protein
VEEETRKRRHAYELETPDVDKITSNAWRNAGQLFPETAWFITSIQGQVCINSNCEKYILKDPNATNDICKIFRQKSGAIQHVELQVARYPIVTIKQPALSIKNWLSNPECKSDYKRRIISTSHNPC